ncbi:FAD-dependent oxidoreductase [Paenibacillus thiaminolyticus]|uniref:hydroxysqualene dehydroxylase n=1 Tax=Paenibacillus thiaminolyticus TaxID=49283 RepID=UPI001165B94F|nr:FAD-dependent oxidoreductase [Paenibacillus thiaminolyticus]MDG0875014.1 FAD-dependent oxidoreductase [Paenibacillus thiaminolyticus]NGP57196.1 FAD-dependent oxidoreductase [Paenibacillus thiaminolyticus]
MVASVHPSVVVLGGGIAGMSAAQELMERGFHVTVLESRRIPGGKARSMPVPGTGTEGRRDLPAEHGFRFFPKFYKHVTDTMKRIPYQGGRRSVYDNLIEGTNLGLAFFDRPMQPFLTEFPQSISGWRTLLKSLFRNNLRLSEHDIDHYVSALWKVLTSCDERRLLDYQRVSWWDFLQAEKQSPEFRHIFTGLTRILVAARAREVNACTVGTVGATIMLDMVLPGGSADRLLNGPTNDVWITPWLDYLRQGGVDYRFGAQVEHIHCEDSRIQGVTVTENGQSRRVTADYYIAALPVEVMAGLLNEGVLAGDPLLGGLIELATHVEWMNGVQFYLKEDVPIIHGHVIYMDSPWALTSVSQAQFWPEFRLSDYGNGQVRGIISIDVSDWKVPGILYGKPAMECTRGEIKAEVWEQIKRSLNQDKIVLSDDMLVEWNLDEDIQYEEGRATNAEPLLVNHVNTWNLRPNAYTAIPNLFLASDYVRTNTDLATMESANEAARRAVNCILERAGSDASPCKIWDMYDYPILSAWRSNDRTRFHKGLPWNGKIIG